MAGRMVSLARTATERRPSMGDSLLRGDEYPYGLCLTLTDAEMEKMSLSHEGVEPGDLLHLMLMTRVESVSKDGDGCTIRLTTIAGRVENESTESADEADDDED